jgi:hypothetical protein
MERPENSDLNWDTLHDSGGNLVIAFASGHPRHIAVIPNEVLEDGLQTMNEDPVTSARANAVVLKKAVQNALERNDWQELVKVGDGTKLFQLWLTRTDFSSAARLTLP